MPRPALRASTLIGALTIAASVVAIVTLAAFSTAPSSPAALAPDTQRFTTPSSPAALAPGVSPPPALAPAPGVQPGVSPPPSLAPDVLDIGLHTDDDSEEADILMGTMGTTVRDNFFEFWNTSGISATVISTQLTDGQPLGEISPDTNGRISWIKVEAGRKASVAVADSFASGLRATNVLGLALRALNKPCAQPGCLTTDFPDNLNFWIGINLQLKVADVMHDCGPMRLGQGSKKLFPDAVRNNWWIGGERCENQQSTRNNRIRLVCDCGGTPLSFTTVSYEDHAVDPFRVNVLLAVDDELIPLAR